MMLLGEPYVADYLEKIDETIADISADISVTVTKFEIIPKHVQCWVLS